jgi:predicted MPP superfamily phosphohydrolase
MKYTFLHVSDLHYRPDWPEGTELVCQKFAEDLSSQAKNYENLYLVFSGDLVYAGGDPKLYPAFEERFVKALNRAGFPKERRICVPGNHDVSQDALKPLLLIQTGTLAQISSEAVFNDSLPQNSKTFLAPKFENYVKFEPEFARYTCCTSHLGGAGWELPDGVGVYCLNTAICSSAGLLDPAGKPISDKDRLMVDTRSLHRWIGEANLDVRILVMHHPLDWLSNWAKSEIEKIIANSFQLVFCGHVHENSASFSTRGVGGAVHCVAPPLFTKKGDLLGYSFVTLETGDRNVEVVYRQWSPTQKFVTGTSLAGNDHGKLAFAPGATKYAMVEVMPPKSQPGDTLAILQAEFDEARTCYRSKKQLWVDRDIANMPETDAGRDEAVTSTQWTLVKNFRPCIIRAPVGFGLTCLGRFIAVEHCRLNGGAVAVAMCNTEEIPHHRQGVIQHIENRCKELKIQPGSLAGIILDSWYSDKRTRRILRELKAEFAGVPVVLLHSVDDCRDIATSMDVEEIENRETLYLWSLTRARIRELVVSYMQGVDSLDDNAVTNKVIADIDALNIHRTPLNCLLILKLTEQAFDDSPVNRTEMIGRVLYILFFQFNKIPRYATRPDLKDCEYALGFFCEWLIRSKKTSFSKNDFYTKVQEYCTAQILDLDIEVLFAFLATENVFIRKGLEFEFRFSYWLYFFAAHRMHHDSKFAEFILSDFRYSAFPEIVEFYAGIDRRREDAVIRLTEDLKGMNAEFLNRTGIPAEFNPLKIAHWSPSDEVLERLQREVTESIAGSALPAEVKDALADSGYNRAKPYNQALAQFIEESSLRQMIQAMKGAARALRNSDHVPPAAKTKLLEEVLTCWIRVCQILMVLSPALADHKRATFEGMNFSLDKTFDRFKSAAEIWEAVMSAIMHNVVRWYQEDIFSKKMGALLTNYVHTNPGDIGEGLVLMLMVRQRPPGWEKEVERFIVREKKNSYYLSRVYAALWGEYKVGFVTERTRQELRRLAAMAVAKHVTGSKRPNLKLIEKTKAAMDRDAAKST